MFANILSRLRRLHRGSRKQGRRPYHPNLDQLEERLYPNSPLGLAQASLAGVGLSQGGARLFDTLAAAGWLTPDGTGRSGQGPANGPGRRADAGRVWLSAEVPLALVTAHGRPAPREEERSAAAGAEPGQPSRTGSLQPSAGGRGWQSADDLFRDPLHNEWTTSAVSAATGARRLGSGSLPAEESGGGKGPGGASGGAVATAAPAGGFTFTAPLPPAGKAGAPENPGSLEALAGLGGGPGTTTGTAEPAHAPAPDPSATDPSAGMVFLLGASSSAPSGSGTAAPTGPAVSRPSLRRDRGRQPLAFEPNRGQVSSAQVQFLARGPGYTTFLTPNEMVLTLRRPVTPAVRSVLRVQLVGANPQARAVGTDPLRGLTNYYVGRDPRQWLSGVPQFGRVTFRDVYPGIDLVYYGTTQGQLEYDFVVRPGANPGSIRLAYQNTQPLTVDAQGHLSLRVGGGTVVQRAPVLYQHSAQGVRQAVAGHYVLQPGNQVTFQVGAYDAQRPLYIDPELTYGSYLGGVGNDEGHAVATDGGNVYVAGSTTSDRFFPEIGGQVSASVDAFVRGLDSEGYPLFTTIFGGSDFDQANGVAVNGSGTIHVTGTTRSLDFMIAGAQADGSLGGTQDAFIATFDGLGVTAFSAYLGGPGVEEGNAIAVDPSSVAYYVTGSTTSSTGFATPFAFQQSRQGPQDAFLAVVQDLNPFYVSYLGGTGSETGWGVAVGDGGVYLTGQTSAATGFPFRQATQTAYGGGAWDAFAAKINPFLVPEADQLLFSTLLGGNQDDVGRGIAVDPRGFVYVTGWTRSTNFSTTPYAYMPDRPPGDTSQAGFLTGYNLGGASPSVAYSSYLNGSADDAAYAVAVNAEGRVFVAGQTYSTDWLPDDGYPVSPGSLPGGPGIVPDAFVVSVNGGGVASRLGGAQADSALGVAVHPSGAIYVTG